MVTTERFPTYPVTVMQEATRHLSHAHQWSNDGSGNLATCGSCEEGIAVPVPAECIYCSRSVFEESPITPDHLMEFGFEASEWSVTAYGGSWSEQDGDPEDHAAFWHLNCAEDIDAADGFRAAAGYPGFTSVTLRFDDIDFTFPALQREDSAALFITDATLRDLQRHAMVDGEEGANDYPPPVLHPGEFIGLRDINGWEVNFVDPEPTTEAGKFLADGEHDELTGQVLGIEEQARQQVLDELAEWARPMATIPTESLLLKIGMLRGGN